MVHWSVDLGVVWHAGDLLKDFLFLDPHSITTIEAEILPRLSARGYEEVFRSA